MCLASRVGVCCACNLVCLAHIAAVATLTACQSQASCTGVGKPLVSGHAAALHCLSRCLLAHSLLNSPRRVIYHGRLLILVHWLPVPLLQGRHRNPKQPELWLAAIRTEQRAGSTKAAEALLAKALQVGSTCCGSGLAAVGLFVMST